MSSLSYLGSKLTPISMVLAGSLGQMCLALASSSVLKMLAIEGMAGLSSAMGTQRLSSLSSAMATAAAASSMLTCSQSSALYPSLHGDYPSGPGYLEHEVGIAGDGHEFDITWLSEVDVVRPGEVDYL
jgi:hypothetical protein